MQREVDKMKGKLLGVLGALLLALLAAPAIAATVYIEPNTTTVALGQQFAVDVSVKDGTAKRCSRVRSWLCADVNAMPNELVLMEISGKIELQEKLT
jgi:hypothetical protein